MIALLAVRPVRLKNFSSTTIGQHLLKTEKHYILTFPSEEVKNHCPITFHIPESLQPALEFYLTHMRPILIGSRQTERLWVGKNGEDLKGPSIYHRFKKITPPLVGTFINPHLMRDCAATTLAVTSPTAALTARDILGHQHYSTTEKYYIQANNLDASLKMNETLATIKNQFSPRKKPPHQTR